MKGKTNVTIPIAIIILLAVFGFIGWQVVSKSGGTTVFQSVNQYQCSNGAWVTNLNLCPATQPQPPQIPTTPASADTLAIKDFSIKVREPYSLSWSAYAGTLRIFEANANLGDPNAAAITTTSITSGAGSQSSWNVHKTNTLYKVVLDGDNTYYSTLIDPFYFLGKNYNKALGTYSMILGDSGSERLTSTDYPNVFVGEKIGSAKITITNNNTEHEAATTAVTNLTYDESVNSGTWQFDMKVENSAANTLIKDAVLHPQNDQANPYEGNEFTAATIQHVSGTDLGLPSNVLNYLTGFTAIKLGNVKGGIASTDTWTITVSEANLDASTDVMHIYFDDLNGYRNYDILTGDIGMAAIELQLKDQA